jgi:flagellar hook-length control protein FliK
MTPQPVASAPKEMTPRHPPVPLPDFGVDFAHVLGQGTPASPPHASNQTAAPVRPKAKDNIDTAAAAAATAAAVPTPPAQVLQAFTAATTAGVIQVTAPAASTAGVTQVTAPAQSPSAVLAAAASTPPGSANATSPEATAGSSAAAGTGHPTAMPPGAAALNARVVAAAPSYLSQPNSALAGLWHNTGAEAETAPSTQQPKGADAGPPAAGAPAAPAPATPSPPPPGPALANDPATPAHAAPGIAAAVAASPGPTTASASTDTDASVAGAATVALPATSAQAPQAAAPVASPTLTAPTIMPAAEQVAIQLKQAAQNGTNRIEIQLKPASLGAINVKLDVTHDGRITAMISADRSDTLNLLRQDSSGLQQALRDAGLQADSGSLSFNLRGDPQSSPHYSAPAPTPANAATPARDSDATPSTQSQASRYRRHGGALNIEV